MSNQGRRPPSGTLASTNHPAPRRRAHLRGRARRWVVQAARAAAASWHRPQKSAGTLAVARGLAGAAAPDPVKVCAPMNGRRGRPARTPRGLGRPPALSPATLGGARAASPALRPPCWCLGAAALALALTGGAAQLGTARAGPQRTGGRRYRASSHPLCAGAVGKKFAPIRKRVQPM